MPPPVPAGPPPPKAPPLPPVAIPAAPAVDVVVSGVALLLEQLPAPTASKAIETRQANEIYRKFIRVLPCLDPIRAAEGGASTFVDASSK
jgi:hypothetical protein